MENVTQGLLGELAESHMCQMANQIEGLLASGEVTISDLKEKYDPLYLIALLGRGYCYKGNPERSASVIAQRVIETVDKNKRYTVGYIDYLYDNGIVGEKLEHLYTYACAGIDDLFFTTIGLMKMGVFPEEKIKENLSREIPVQFVPTNYGERLLKVIEQHRDVAKLNREIAREFLLRLEKGPEETISDEAELKERIEFARNAYQAQVSWAEMHLPTNLSVLTPSFRNVYIDSNCNLSGSGEIPRKTTLESAKIYGAIGRLSSEDSALGRNFNNGSVEDCLNALTKAPRIHCSSEYDTYLTTINGDLYPIAAVVFGEDADHDCWNKISNRLGDIIYEDSGNYPLFQWVARKTEKGTIGYLAILNWACLEKKDKTQTSTDSTYFTY